MTRNAHDDARELIAVAGANDKDLSCAHQTWLRDRGLADHPESGTRRALPPDTVAPG